MYRQICTCLLNKSSYLLSRSGRTISGLMRDRLCRVMAASIVPNLLKMAIFMTGMRLCTNASMSCSVSFAFSGIELYHLGLLNLSLMSEVKSEGGRPKGGREGREGEKGGRGILHGGRA